MKNYDINVMDIETFTEDGKLYPYCICLKLNSKDVSFWYDENIIMNFLNYVSENAKKDYVEIYTHNINFDGLIIIDGIKNKGIFFDMFIRNHNIYWIKLNNLKINILIRCSFKIIPASVSNLGNLIGFNKKAFPHKFVNRDKLNYTGKVPNSEYFNSEEDYNTFLADNITFNLKSATLAYCFQDVEIVYRVLVNVLSILLTYYGSSNIIKKSFSFSSLSYKLYSKKFDKFSITKKSTLIANSVYIKNAYYGGRCEVFGNPRPGEIIHYFDYKGMYAQCMLEKFPYGAIISKNKNLSLNNPGFHTIRFKCDNYLPFLPIRNKKLIFPNGEIIGTYWYEEIANAVLKGRCKILEHYSSLEFENEDYLFKDFVNEFLELREKGIYYNILGKNIINGLYGSFALNDEPEAYIITLSDAEFSAYIKMVDVISFKKIGNAYIIKIEKNTKSKKLLDKKDKWELNYKKRNVAYAAVIASKARIKLNNSLDLVLRDGGKLFYTDTDSIFAGYNTNKLGHRLGDIKWSKTYKDGVFITSKFYYLEEEGIKLKGINKNTYSFSEIKNKFYATEKKIMFDQQLKFNKTNFELNEILGIKSIKIDDYDKRIFTENKKNTVPIYFQTDNV